MISDYWDTLKKTHFSFLFIYFLHFFFLVVVSSDEEGPIEHKNSEILKLQSKQDHDVTNEDENISESALSELPMITCESVQVIYFCLLVRKITKYSLLAKTIFCFIKKNIVIKVTHFFSLNFEISFREICIYFEVKGLYHFFLVIYILLL